jgi:CelD/BcsL family acetyltransferase involved in cellulose biosynthesis
VTSLNWCELGAGLIQPFCNFSDQSGDLPDSVRVATMLRAPATTPGCRVELTGTLGEWAASWDDLVLQAPVPSPFLRSWWLGGVETPGSRYLLVLDGDTLIGGLALEAAARFGVTWYHLAGAGRLCPDHLDLIAAAERRGAVVDAVRGWFTSRGNRLLDANGLVADSLLSSALPRSVRRQIDVAPCEPLTTAADYARDRSASFRRDVKRRGKHLAEHGVELLAPGAVEPEEALAAFAELHNARDDRVELMTAWERLKRALAAGAERSEVQFHLARTAESVVAVAVCFAVGGRLAFYQNARSLDPRFSGVGTVLDYTAICAAADSGMREVDLLRGDEEYKRRFVSHERALYRLTAAHGVRATALQAGLVTLRSAARIVRRATAIRAARSARSRALHASPAQ